LSRFLLVLGLVDPHGSGQLWWLGWLADEPFGMGIVGGIQDAAAGLADGVRAAVVDVGWGVQADPGVPVFVAVPAEEPVTEDAGILDGPEPFGEVRPVLQGLELRL
jgi:hypothetical protein